MQNTHASNSRPTSGPVSILPGRPNIFNVKHFLLSVILHNNLLHTLMHNTTAAGQLSSQEKMCLNVPIIFDFDVKRATKNLNEPAPTHNFERLTRDDVLIENGPWSEPSF